MKHVREWIRGTAVVIALLVHLAPARGEPLVTASPPRPLGKGSIVVLRSSAAVRETPVDDPGDLLIHFHGAADTIRLAMERAGIAATVVVVNQPGLSAAYTAPFRDDAKLFSALLAEPARRQATDETPPVPRWRRITLSCFSAGYGAVREILKDPQAFDRVAAIVAADSIYAGLEEPPAAAAADARRVDTRDMARFVAFATAAVAGEKVFVITHSAQPTPYASTTETADCLLANLRLQREPIDAVAGEEFSQVSRAGRGGFAVLGFTGASGPAHAFHLRAVDRWWKVAESLGDELSRR